MNLKTNFTSSFSVVAALFCAGCSGDSEGETVLSGADAGVVDASGADVLSGGDRYNEPETDRETGQTEPDADSTTPEGDPPDEADIDVERFNTPGKVAYTKQFGSPYDETGYVIIARDGYLYLAGITAGNLGGNWNERPGTFDVFVMKLTPDATPVWTTLWGTISQEGVNKIVMEYDAASDSLVLAGDTLGAFPGAENVGNCGTVGTPAPCEDIFLSRVDAESGQVLWTRQHGSEGRDLVEAMQLGSDGKIYLTGTTNGLIGAVRQGGLDVFLSRYTADGVLDTDPDNKPWAVQWGSKQSDKGKALHLGTDGSIVVAGESWGNMLDREDLNEYDGDIFVVKFSDSGQKAPKAFEWLETLGSSGEHDWFFDAFHRGNKLFVTGSTQGALASTGELGSGDYFLVAFDLENHATSWSAQWGTTNSETARAVIAFNDRVFVTGWAGDALEGCTAAGGRDLFLSHFDDLGGFHWNMQWGSEKPDPSTPVFPAETAQDLTFDGQGNIYITGYSAGDFSGHLGKSDIILSKITF